MQVLANNMGPEKTPYVFPSVCYYSVVKRIFSMSNHSLDEKFRKKCESYVHCVANIIQDTLFSFIII